MFCGKCGTKIKEDDDYCVKCGNKAVKKKKSEIVLTADTVVALGRRIIQKPNNKKRLYIF